MDFEPEGTHESLIGSSQEKTARRTRHLLVAARLAFVFSHGALAVSVSAALGWEVHASWWAIFTPVWLGDALCAVLCIWSWFASCPYIKLCLAERQARLGDSNPSILTEILPDIVWAIFGLVWVCLALTGELMLCRYLDRGRTGQEHMLWPSAVVFFVVSLLACCRGVCVRTSGELFVYLGAGALATCAVALWVPGGASGGSGWVLVLPSLASSFALLVAAARRLRRIRSVLTQEERLLRAAEQAVLLMVLVALAVLAVALAARSREGGGSAPAALAGGVAGAGVCLVSALRARMAVVENRQSCSISERLLCLCAAPMAMPRSPLPVGNQALHSACSDLRRG